MIANELGPSRSCFSRSGRLKRAFATREEAEAAKQVMIEEGLASNRRPFKVYTCGLHGFHIAHMLPKGKRKKASRETKES